MNHQTTEQLRDWAFEHLDYEVTTLTYAIGCLTRNPTGSEANVLVESFAVHARCLHDFMWRDRQRKTRDTDAFAADFCAPGIWAEVREPVPPHLANVIERKRFGAEVMHLTYKRISGITEQKRWPCGAIYVEIADALSKFADTALPDRLRDSTRASFKDLTITGSNGVRFLSHATGMAPTHPISGGSVNLSDVNVGGTA